jgi:hypothetical protein
MARKRIGRFVTSALFSCCAAILVAAFVCPRPLAAPRKTTDESCFPLPSLRFALESREHSPDRVVEVIPKNYRKRYLKWKNDYLSTQVGRTEWYRYALDPNFKLTITISKEWAEGAIVDNFHWDDNGRLIAATITLGHKLDSGYPSSINYPITCSLAPGNLPPEAKGTILAATKIAHEFGHLDRTMSMDGRLYQLQNSLMIQYLQIFNANGHDCKDPRLLALVEQMSGTPVSIQQDRESWAEVGAIQYLKERLARGRDLKMPDPIKQAIEAYYLTYPERSE